MKNKFLIFLILILSACSGTQNTCEKKQFGDSYVETCYKNGLKNGIETIYGDKGQIINKSEWKNGKQNGQETEYFDNGNISRIRTFVNDEIRGEYKQFYDDGNLMFNGYRVDTCALKYGTCYTENGTAVPLEKADLDKACYNHLCLDAIKKVSDNNKDNEYYDFPLSEYIHNEYKGYMGKYFLNDAEKFYSADIGKNDDGIYFLERNLTDNRNTMYLCSAPIQRTKLGGYLFHCKTPYTGNSDFFIKLEMVYSDNKTDKIIFVSMGDDKECIKKYSSPDKFKEYCNPKTNDKIKKLKLYNLHF